MVLDLQEIPESLHFLIRRLRGPVVVLEPGALQPPTSPEPEDPEKLLSAPTNLGGAPANPNRGSTLE